MKAGYIGLGHIGRGMARELVVAGHETLVYDVMPEGPAELAALGARIAASPAEVAAGSEAMGVCVRTDQDVFDVFDGPDGILAGAAPGLLVAVHSTVRPSTVRTIGARAAEKGVRIVDAPVSRGSMEPAGKIIVYMLGGAAADVDDARAFVEPSAKAIVVAGDLGSAMALKISNNLVTYTQLMAGYEAFRLATEAGLDPALLLEVMTSNGNATPTMQQLMRGWIAQTGPASEAAMAHARQFTAIGQKDLDCALEVAAEVGLDLPGTATARAQVARVMLGAARNQGERS